MSGDAVLEHTLGFVLDPTSTALVVIDMQYATACRTTGLGRWLAERGREEEGRYRFDRIEELLLPNIARLLACFRDHDLTRIFVRLGGQMEGCRDLIPHLRELETDFGNIAGEREFEFLEELAPLPGEPVLTKLSASAFTSSNIDALLRNLRVRTLVLTGVSTSQCVDLTARDAADRGLHVRRRRRRGRGGPARLPRMDARAVPQAVRPGGDDNRGALRAHRTTAGFHGEVIACTTFSSSTAPS